MHPITTVFFDFGGVIADSPFANLARYEQEQGLPADFIRLTNADNPIAFAGSDFDDPAVMLRWAPFFDLGPSSYFEFGLTGMVGPNGNTDSSDTTLGSIDFNFIWEPVDRARYRGVELRGQYIHSNYEAATETYRTSSFFTYVSWKFARRWIAGVRYDNAGVPDPNVLPHHDDLAVQDLTAELEVAYHLVQHKPFTVTYEPYGSQKTRGSDFGVTFKSHHFNVEVTRIDSINLERLAGGGFDSQQAALRLMDTVCDKLGQMRPGMSNVLVVMTDSDFFAALEMEQTMTQLKERVEKKEPGLYGRYGFEKPADFFKNYLHLSGMLVCTITEPDEANQLALWLNNQAKHALSAPLQTNLERSLRKV